jgi:D-alanyl-D-alanine dipeptidase
VVEPGSETAGKGKGAMERHADRHRVGWAIVLTCAVLCLFHRPALGDGASGNGIEARFIKAGLVNVQSIDPQIQVDLVNADAKKNYFRKNFYGGLKTAYLRKEVALKLSRAQKILRSKHPGYALLILDAARPRSVSRKMYQQVKGTKYERFVANPDRGSMHNYGIAVDITIVDASGDELDMGFSPFRKSTLELYWLFAKKKMGVKLSDRQKKNRRLLADTMAAAGFTPLGFEWWHFNGLPKAEVRKHLTIIE